MARRSIRIPRPPVGGIAVRERLDVVGVAGLGLDVAPCSLVGLHREPGGLLRRVVDLGEGVPELHPACVVLEPLDDPLLGSRSRERRELDGVVVEDRRGDQIGLDGARGRGRSAARRSHRASRPRVRSGGREVALAVQSPCSRASVSFSRARRRGRSRGRAHKSSSGIPARHGRRAVPPAHRVLVVRVGPTTRAS